MTDVSVKDSGSGDAVKELLIKRNTLVQVNYKSGKSEAVENYRVLVLFTKYYNNWSVAQVEHYPWKNGPLAVKNERVWLRMTKKRGGSYNEERLEAGSAYGSKQIFCIKNTVIFWVWIVN